MMMRARERERSWSRPVTGWNFELYDIHHWLRKSHRERGHAAIYHVGVGGFELELGKVVTWVLENCFTVCLCAGVQTWGKKGLAEASYAW